MLALVIQAAQQAVPQLPPINVTVQQPSGGMPEWTKILISATVGAIVGVASNIAMEFIKPWVAKLLMRKTILQKVILGELKQNLDTVAGISRMGKRAAEGSEDDRGMATSYFRLEASGISDELYQSYYVSQRLLMDELDPARELPKFYERVWRAQKFADELDFGLANTNLSLATTKGTEILAKHGLEYAQARSSYDSYFLHLP